MRYTLRCVSAWVMIAIFAAGARGQVQASDLPPDIQAADALIQAGDWAGGAKAFEQATKAHPDSGYAWFRLGLCYQSLKEYPKALATYETAEQKGYIPVGMRLRRARTYALMGEKNKALEILQKLAADGFAQIQLLQQEPDLDALRDDPRFAAILDSMQRNAAPCKYDPHYREFDFWVGEWNVYSTQGGQQAGTSSIQSILGDCVIFENWTGASGGSGKSFNIYDASSKHWEQIWVDQSGALTKFVGGVQDGVMDYRAESMDADGKKTVRRLRFAKLSDDRVHQWSVVSTDGGKTWISEYDLTYVRKK